MSDELESEDEDKAGEAFLRARGWAPYPGGDGKWFQLHGAFKPTPRAQAVARQLKNDVTAFVYMLQAVDETKPGTRKLLGSLITGFVLHVLEDFWADFWQSEKTAVIARIQEGVPKLFADVEFRQAIEALHLLWHVQGKANEKPKKVGEPN